MGAFLTSSGRPLYKVEATEEKACVWGVYIYRLASAENLGQMSEVLMDVHRRRDGLADMRA